VFVHGLFLHQKSSNYALTNLLFGLCRFVRIIGPLVTCHSPHPKALARPSTLEVLQAKERTPIPYPFVVFTLNSQLKRSVDGSFYIPIDCLHAKICCGEMA